MGLLEIFLTGVALAMDAFAVSICKGLEQKKFNAINMLIIAFLFGFFQFAMPLIAYFCCKGFAGYIQSFDHWIAFGLLSFIGLKMIIECVVEYKKEKKNLIKDANIEGNTKNNNELNKEEFAKKESEKTKLNLKELIILAIATSIDALVVGITLALTNANIFLASGIIGIVTFVICCGGVLIGTFFGSKFKTSAEIVGGIILILIGLKILLEHLGVLVF